MCLLIVRLAPGSGTPLVVAANRDELYERPAAPTGLLTETPYPTLGIKDLLAGGTALAANDRGIVAALTNKPSGGRRDPDKRSRGAIPLALTEHPSAREAAADFTERYAPATFNPCWVIVADRESAHYIDLTSDSEANALELEAGVHVLENAPLGEPTPKAEYVRQRVEDGTPLDALLRDHTKPGGAISPPCVHTDLYGTRSATIVEVPADPARPPAVRASDGPSCVNPLVPVSF